MLKKSIQYTSFYINISLNWMQRNFLICESAYVLFYFRGKKTISLFTFYVYFEDN